MNHSLTKGRIGPALLRFALPFIFANFIQALYGAVDLFVVGRYSGSAAVSAVSIGSMVMMTITGIILGISMGGTVILGNKIGAEDPEGASNAVGNLTFLFLVFALVLTPLMVLLVNPITTIMQTPSEAVEEAHNYLKICSWGIPFIIGYNGVSAVYRGSGDSRTPIVFIGFACVLNILGDFFLTGYCHLSASGAAYATIFAQAMSFLLALIFLRRKGLGFRIDPKDILPKKAYVRQILAIGSPIALQDALVNVSFLVITALINTLGLVASAAVGVTERLLGFAFLIPGGFGSSVATMVSQNLGAGEKERAKSSVRISILICGITGMVMSLCCNLFPEVLTGIFSKDPDVIRAASEYLRIYSLDLILVAYIFNMNAWLTSNELSLVCFGHSMAATFLVRIPATWFLKRFAEHSLVIMGLAAPLASVLSILICTIVLTKRNMNPFKKG